MTGLQRRVLSASAIVLALFAGADATAQSSLFRFSDMDLRDPHVFYSPGFGCFDVTTQFNDQLQIDIQGDANGDGFLDRSTVVEFLPLDQTATTNLFDSGRASCTAPLATTACGPIIASAIMGDATLSTTTTCLSAVPGTTRPYAPAITDSTAPCFASPAATVQFDFGGTPVTFTGAQIGGRFVGNPATNLDNGLLRGFISETDANNTMVNVPNVGLRPLASLLAGGTGSCPTHSDKDVFNGVTGWWFYFNYVAPRTERFVDNFADGFADGFEP